MQFIAAEVFTYLFIWLEIPVFLYKWQGISKNGNTTLLLQYFWMNFWSLVFLLTKKLILECKTVWQSVRKVLWPVWSVRAFVHIRKEDTFLYWKLRIGMARIFLIITYSWELKIWKLKNFWEFSHKLFWNKRYQPLLCPNDVCPPFDC